MLLSCLPVSLFKDIIGGKMSIKEWASFAADAGLDGIDISILFLKNRTPTYLETLADELRQTRMNITMVTTYPDFTHPSAMQREREMSYLIADIAAASQLNAKYLRITAGQNHDVEDLDKTLAIVADSFIAAKKRADFYGVKLLFENHSKPGAWSRPDFLFDTHIFLQLAERLRQSGIGINFDTANTLAFGDNPIPVFQKVLPQVDTIHVSDVAAAGSLRFTAIGSGASPIKEIFSMAKSSGFNGWICIEEASNNGLAGIKNAADFVRGAWEQA